MLTEGYWGPGRDTFRGGWTMSLEMVFEEIRHSFDLLYQSLT